MGGRFFFFFVINSVGKSPGNHKQEHNSASKHSLVSRPKEEEEKANMHLPICKCVIGDLEKKKKKVSAKSDVAGPEKQ